MFIKDKDLCICGHSYKSHRLAYDPRLGWNLRLKCLVTKFIPSSNIWKFCPCPEFKLDNFVYIERYGKRKTKS